MSAVIPDVVRRSEQWLWHGRGRIERAGVACRAPRPGHVLLEVGAVGICGTDLHIIEGRIPAVAPPAPLGHELAGTVVATGPDVLRVVAGDRCCVDPLIVCGRCSQCLQGRPQHCLHGAEIGIDIPGGWQTLLEVPERNCWQVPSEMRMAIACQAEPLHVVLGAIDRMAPRPGESALIIGDGPTALYFAALLLHAGCRAVTLAGMRPHRLAAAARWGADVVDVREADLGAALEQPPDIVIDAVGVPETVGQAVSLVRPGGRIALFGLPADDRVPVDVRRIVMREITLVGGSNAPHVWPRVVRLLAGGHGRVQDVVTHVVGFDSLPAAVALAADPPADAIKVVVDLTEAAS
jgi:threonine dehydrogenase-like Zn-dependent dehydrogenase